MHCYFGLHLVRSYRGQSNSPNLQNVPVRDPVQGKVVRRAFIPRPGHALVEIDYSSAEVRVACTLSGDKKLTYDTIEGDMHRDMAAECYMLPPDAVYKQCCKNLWDGITRYDLTTSDGTNLHDHLVSKGIVARGACNPKKEAKPSTFEAHIKAVEDRFWNERFHVYHAKRRAWVEEYKRQGYIDIVTGFRCHGPMSKNQVMNYHIQGPAFHCLLWSLIELQAEIKRRRMRAKIVAQIHDSLVADVPLTEMDDYLALASDITTNRLRKAWSWISIPLEVEAEASAVNWYEKKEIKIPA